MQACFQLVFSQPLAILTIGDPQQSFSSLCYERGVLRDNAFWRFLMRRVDNPPIYDPGHCRKAFMRDYPVCCHEWSYEELAPFFMDEPDFLELVKAVEAFR